MSRREHDKEFEFIANWNEFMKFKIDEQNLKKPNFQFFYGALESILRSLNYDIDKIKFNTSAPDSERIYYIKFCAYIDRFYKLSGSQNRFYFYDLINPVPKKCFHVLRALLNYSMYYDMVKKEVCTKASHVLAEYNNALEQHSQLLKKNKEIEHRAKEMECRLSELDEAIPRLQKDIAKLKKEKDDYEADIKEKNDNVKELERLAMKTDVKHAELSEQIVTDDDYDKAVATYNDLKVELHELKNIAEHTRSSTVELSTQVDTLNKVIDGLAKTMESHKLAEFEELIGIQTEKANINKAVESKKQKIKEFEDKIESITKDVEKVNADIKERGDKLKGLKKDMKQHKTESKQANVNINKMIHDARTKLDNLRTEVDDLEEQQQLLMNSFLEFGQRATSNDSGIDLS